MNLKQAGNMTIAQYEDYFTRLIKYMPIYNLDEEAKAQKFLSRLKLEIQLALSSLGAHTYAEVVLQAMTVESNLHRMNSLRNEFRELENKKLGKMHDLGVRGENFKHKENCPRCQKFHPGKPCDRGNQKCSTCGGKDHMPQDCPKGPMCFNCQRIGHLFKDCPQRREVNQSRTNQGDREPQRGRVFQLTGNNTDANPTKV